MPDTEYAAVKATNLLNDETYNAIKNFLIAEGRWTDDMKDIRNKNRRNSIKVSLIRMVDSRLIQIMNQSVFSCLFLYIASFVKQNWLLNFSRKEEII